MTVRLHLGTLKLRCKGSQSGAQPGEGAVRVGVAKKETSSHCTGSRCHPTVGPSTMSCTQRPSEVISSFLTRAGRTWCCRLWSVVGVASGIVGQPSCQPSPGPCVWFSGQPNEHRLPGTGVPFTGPGSPRTAAARRGEQSWPGAQRGPRGAVVTVLTGWTALKSWFSSTMQALGIEPRLSS